ncbi:MAG: sigma factor-like helix-turn-helix DNA-binding protein [Verrucomicrobiota bacterium]
MRHVQRRQQREYVTLSAGPDGTTASDAAWSDLKPLLDDALQELGDADRHAVVLRFLKGADFASVGHELGLSADAARMRVSRSLEKLRLLLKRRGLSASVLALEALLSQDAVEAVPAGLDQSISRAVRTLPRMTTTSLPVLSGIKMLGTAAVPPLPRRVGHGEWNAGSRRTARPARFAETGGPNSPSGWIQRRLATAAGRPRLRPLWARAPMASLRRPWATCGLRSSIHRSARPGEVKLMEESAGMLGWTGRRSHCPLPRSARRD